MKGYGIKGSLSASPGRFAFPVLVGLLCREPNMKIHSRRHSYYRRIEKALEGLMKAKTVYRFLTPIPEHNY